MIVSSAASVPRWMALGMLVGGSVFLGASPAGAEPASAKQGQKAAVDPKHVDHASGADKARAQALYLEAMKHFDAEEYEAARDGFLRSLDVVRSPNTRFMVARSQARLGEVADAWRELDRVIEEAEALGGRYAATAEAARAKQDDIRLRVGLIIVELHGFGEKTRVTVDDAEVVVDRVSDPIAVLPGKVTVSAVSQKGSRAMRTVSIEGGGNETVRLTAPTGKGAGSDDGASAEHPIKQEGAHADYIVELDGHVVGETLMPGDTNRGAGAGVRGTFEVLHRGFIPNVNDSLAVGIGFDWVGSSQIPHYWLPIAAQYNVWIVPRFSMFAEVGVAVMFAAGGDVAPNVALGARFEIVRDRLTVVGRGALPASTLGLSLFL